MASGRPPPGHACQSAERIQTRQEWMESTAPGAHLGHVPGDNKGQQRYRAVSRDPALTSDEGSEQQCS